MTSQDLDQYLSEPWFERVDPIVSRHMQPTAGRSFTVQHRIENCETGSHFQTYTSTSLLAWEPGSISDPDLTIARAYECDLGDQLVRWQADDIWRDTTLGIAGSGFGLLGALRIQQSGLEIPGLDLCFDVIALSSPVGRVTARYRLCEDMLFYTPRTDHSEVVTIEAEYGYLLAWFEGPLLIRDLIEGGARVTGNLVQLSAIDGFVSWPRETMDEPTRVALSAFAAMRNGAAWQRLVDDIDEATA